MSLFVSGRISQKGQKNYIEVVVRCKHNALAVRKDEAPKGTLLLGPERCGYPLPINPYQVAFGRTVQPCQHPIVRKGESASLSNKSDHPREVLITGVAVPVSSSGARLKPDAVNVPSWL